jgi:hypothetical protein
MELREVWKRGNVEHSTASPVMHDACIRHRGACLPVVKIQIAHGRHGGEIGGAHNDSLPEVEAIAERVPAT